MPSSGLVALLNSPTSNDSTVIANGKTLPDITLGSLGSSFRSDEQEHGDGRLGAARPPTLPAVSHSPPTSPSASLATPSPPNHGFHPPTTVRRSSSQSVLPDSQAPRRSRILRSQASISSLSSSVDEDAEGRYAAMGAGMGTDDEDDESALTSRGMEGMLSQLEMNGGGGGGKARRSYGGPSRRGGRHSVAADISGSAPLTLRDQEQQLNAAKKDIFNLQLENHFLKERLANMAPDHIEAALKENVKLKLEILNISKEMKKLKKLLLQQDKDLADAQRQREGGGGGEKGGKEARELESMWREEKERRKAAEAEVKRLREDGEGEGGLRERVEDAEASEDVWRKRVEELEGEVDEWKGRADDQAEEVERLRDGRDRAEEEVERLRGERSLLGESVGVGGRGREARKLQRLEEENAKLLAEVDKLRLGAGDDELEDRLNALRDKLAAAQLDLDRRDAEIDQLNEELDGKVRDHGRELEQVEVEWRNEVMEGRGQIEELRDIMEAREQDMKDLREALLEREDELVAATARVEELQAAQAETHDRLEETLKGIERDNAEKEGDLVAANREVDALGQRVYDLEEALEEFRAREDELKAELTSADEAFENTKSHYENLVAALKEARRKLQNERDDALVEAKEIEQNLKGERDGWKREMEGREERWRRQMAEKEQLMAKLRSELDSARDRVLQRDRDIEDLQNALRGLEDERNDHTSDKYGLELEMERARRDLALAEDELARAKEDLDALEDTLRQKDMEVGKMLDKQRDLEARLSSERQGRLNLSDKLDLANKTARKHEREAEHLRDRIEELEPLLTETQQERFSLQKQSEQQRQERSELLLRVYKDVNRFLGTEDHTTPANFAVFRDTLLQRLRSMTQVRGDFEKRIKETEASVDQRMAALKRQLEQKWRALDSFEASVKKLELTRQQWRSKYSIKEGELEAAKARNAELAQRAGSSRASSSAESSSTIRSLTERAQSAEKRAQQATNQLAQLEARIADIQARSGTAEDKWEARVREYENRLRVAGEKIKTEKQGGKERARELEARVRELEKQVELAKKRNQRAEGVVATAAHLMPSDGGYER